MSSFELGRWLDAQLGDDHGRAADIARRSGLGEDTISKLRRGKRKGTSWETITRLAQALGFPTRAHLVAAVDGHELPAHEPSERTVTAIRHDPALTAEQKKLLLLAYETVRRGR